MCIAKHAIGDKETVDFGAEKLIPILTIGFLKALVKKYEYYLVLSLIISFKSPSFIILPCGRSGFCGRS